MSVIWIVFLIFFMVVLPIFWVSPGRMSSKAKETALFFKGRHFAHRGLYEKDQAIPENSLAAFAAARAAGYGVELDVQLTRDEQVVVFHDDSLKRVCGVEERVDAWTWADLQKLALFGGNEKIPLFSKTLEILGDTPVIVELKSAGKNNALLCRKTLALLREKGEHWCVESFDPRIVFWFRRNAPDVLRGQLSAPSDVFDHLSKLAAFAMSRLLGNVAARPHFIAYQVAKKTLLVRLCYALRPMKVVWTVTPDLNPELYPLENDAVIFEHYHPMTCYETTKKKRDSSRGKKSVG